MNATKKTEFSPNTLCVDTAELQNILNSGRQTAVRIGTDASARFKIGRRVFWNVSKIQKYLDTISE